MPEARLTVPVTLRVENTTAEVWKAEDGYAAGYQVFDPESGTLVSEGERIPLARELAPGQSVEVKMRVEFPPEPGRYRAFVSAMREHVCWFYDRGARFTVVDAEVAEGAVRDVREIVTTLRALGRRNLVRGVGRAFRYPVLSIWRHRGLIRSLVRRDILGRYRGSFGGVFWTVLNPLLLVATYFFVFGIVLHTRFGNDPGRAGFVLYFLCGMLPWLAVSEALGRAPLVVLEYRNFVKKLVFPIEILPVNLVLAALVTEAFALLVFFVLLLGMRGAVPWSALWLPVLVIPQVLFTMGLGWFLAGLGVYLRDLGQINGFLLTLWFFLTPICYPIESLPRGALPLLTRNPMFVLVRAYRDILLEGRAPALGGLWKFWAVALLLFFAGHAWFYKLRKTFADVI
jgi:lipopolysaccharide transport system permease protein